MNSAASFLNTEHQSLSNFLFFRSHNFGIQLQAFNIIFHIALNVDDFIELINSFTETDLFQRKYIKATVALSEVRTIAKKFFSIT